MIDAERLRRALNPRTVAVVGDVARSNYRWLRCMSTFNGRVYSVQIDPNEISGIEAMGIPNYASLLDVPEDLDYVLVAVPRVAATAILRDCIDKEVAGAAFFTSGFAETHVEEAIELQREFTAIAEAAGIAVIGPNCIGLYNPALGVRFREDQAAGFQGDTTFISQSGGHAGDISAAAHASGVPVNQVVSFGNGVVLESADYLEYFGEDPATRFIGMYIEGLQDGPRFVRALRAVTLRKPVVIWKGGMTDAGRRATASHTASMAGSDMIWDAMCRQAGAIQANSIDEMIGLIDALRLLPAFTGDGLGVTGGSGGQSVAMADVFSRAGLRVPTLSDESREQLGSWFSLVGASFGNPVDMGSNRAHVDGIFDVLVADPNVDCLLVQIRPPQPDADDAQRMDTQIASVIRVRGRTKKPIAVIAHSPTPARDGAAITALAERLHEAGIPTFISYERAATVIRKVMAYYRYLDELATEARSG